MGGIVYWKKWKEEQAAIKIIDGPKEGGSSPILKLPEGKLWQYY